MEGLRQNAPMTSEGREYRLELLRTNKKTIYKSMLRRSECINQLMETAVNHLAVRSEISNLDSELDEYSNLCQRIKGLMIENEAKDHPDEDEILSLEINQTVFGIKTRALAWLRDCDQRLNVPSLKSRSRGSKSSRSSKSSKHTKASTSSGKSAKEKYVEEAAKIAALKAEAEYISNLASLESQGKIAKSQAKLEIYERFFEPQDTGMATSVQATSNDLSSHPTKVSTNNISSHPWNPVGSTFTSELNPSATNFHGRSRSTDPPISSDSIVKSEVEASTKTPNISGVVSSLLKMQSAPEATIDTFHGNPLEFKYFITTFEEVVESKIDDGRGRLIRLIQFTSGEAKDLIKGCIHFDPNQGYQHAKELLTKRFGDPYRVLSAYRKEVQDWKPMKQADSSSLRQLYTFLVKSSHVVANHFDTPDNICIVLSKLPGNLRDRWNRNVYQIRTFQHREPLFKDLIDFIDKETILASDPLFSREAIGNSDRNTGSINIEERKPKTVRTFYSNVPSCLYCEKNHDIDKCFAFKSIDLKERGKWVLKNRSCFGCYRKGHISRDCKRPRNCNICNKEHPTLLHGYHRKRENTSAVETSNTLNPASVSTNVSNEVSKNSDSVVLENHAVKQFKGDFVNMCIVPVCVKLNQNSI